MNAPDLGRSRDALLASIAPEVEGAQAIARNGSEGLDWNWILERAVAHKVAPLVAARIEKLGLADHLAPAEQERVAAIRAGARHHVDVARNSLSFLDENFRRAAIPFLVVKGSALAELVYPEPDMRTFSDIDLVVSPEHVAAAADVLHSIGCRLGQVRQLLGSLPREADTLEAARRMTRNFYERFEYELPFLAPPGSGFLPIDLHWHIAPRFRLRADLSHVWEHTRRVRIGAVEVTTLDEDATAIHLAIHATTCARAGFRLLHLCDVAWGTAGTGDRLWELAAKWKADEHLRTVLEMSQRLFPRTGGPTTLRKAAPAAALPFGFSRVATPAFLVDAGPGSALGRLWMELRWGVAMGCLRRNVARGLLVRLTRARWRWMQWQVRRSAPDPRRDSK